MKNFVQEGDALDLIAPSGGVVSDVGYIIGGLFVVAAFTAAEGEAFVGLRKGVFDFVGATHASNQAAAAGDTAYWDDSAKKITKTAVGNTPVGIFTEAKVSTVASARVVVVPRQFAPGAAVTDSSGDLAATQATLNTVIARLEAAGVILAN